MTDDARDAAVWAMITGARWFGGKGRPATLRGVTELVVLAGDPAVSIMVAELGYADGGEVEFYQVPVITVDGSLGDATGDPAALAVIMRRLLEAGGRSSAPGDPVRVHLVDAAALSADLPGRRFGGEQSNTSIMYGDGLAGGAMLKVFRRLELGRNPDIEVHEVIGRSGGEAARDAARLFGWVEATWTTTTGERASADLAMLVEQLTDVHDGYAAAFEACRTARSFTAEAAALGRALRNVHDVLRSSFPTRTVDGAAVAVTMRERLDRAAAIAPALAPQAAALGGLFDALAGGPIQAQRIHGDFHLGQALLVGTGTSSAPAWKIIDFEGEPMKTLAERLEPDARVRDVAGALRSFDYAGTADPSSAGRAWVAACRAAFVTGWTGDRDGPPDAELALLRAYEADKAVYEVVYETRNRPDWVEIPLSGLRALVQVDQTIPDQPDATGPPDSLPGGTS